MVNKPRLTTRTTTPEEWAAGWEQLPRRYQMARTKSTSGPESLEDLVNLSFPGTALPEPGSADALKAASVFANHPDERVPLALLDCLGVDLFFLYIEAEQLSDDPRMPVYAYPRERAPSPFGPGMAENTVATEEPEKLGTAIWKMLCQRLARDLEAEGTAMTPLGMEIFAICFGNNEDETRDRNSIPDPGPGINAARQQFAKWAGEEEDPKALVSMCLSADEGLLHAIVLEHTSKAATPAGIAEIKPAICGWNASKLLDNPRLGQESLEALTDLMVGELTKTGEAPFTATYGFFLKLRDKGVDLSGRHMTRICRAAENEGWGSDEKARIVAEGIPQASEHKVLRRFIVRHAMGQHVADILKIVGRQEWVELTSLLSKKDSPRVHQGILAAVLEEADEYIENKGLKREDLVHLLGASYPHLRNQALRLSAKIREIEQAQEQPKPAPRPAARRV